MSQSVLFFEVGKYYRHNGGSCMHIVGSGFTTMWGWTLIAEEHGEQNLKPIGVGLGYSDNWYETTKVDWETGFNKSDSKTSTVVPNNKKDIYYE